MSDLSNERLGENHCKGERSGRERFENQLQRKVQPPSEVLLDLHFILIFAATSCQSRVLAWQRSNREHTNTVVEQSGTKLGWTRLTPCAGRSLGILLLLIIQTNKYFYERYRCYHVNCRRSVCVYLGCFMLFMHLVRSYTPKQSRIQDRYKPLNPEQVILYSGRRMANSNQVRCNEPVTASQSQPDARHINRLIGEHHDSFSSRHRRAGAAHR
jgi:hypothetical protein